MGREDCRGRMTGGPRRVYIGLGSNIGDRGAHLARAIRELQRRGLLVALRSSVYRTAPVDVLDQDDFLNQVIGCDTGLPAGAILEICLSVERDMGRIRTRDRGPRIIDLDLLLAGDEVLGGDGGLELPHPRMHLRRFVLRPLVEIAPGARHPVLGLEVAELLRRCPDRSRVERLPAAPAP